MKKLLSVVVAILLFCVVSAQATVSFKQVKGNASCGGASSCTVPGFTAVPAGSLIVARMGGNGGLAASAGSSNAGTWTVPSGCSTVSDCSESDSTAGNTAIEYILSSTGSPTSIICTATTAVISDCSVAAYTFTGSSMSFDVGNVRDQTTSAASFAGVSAGTLTGTNDVILQYGTTDSNFTGCPNSAASPADFTNGNAFCGLVNTTNNAAGTYTLSASGRGALGAIAFKEAGGGGGSPPPPKLMTLGVGFLATNVNQPAIDNFTGCAVGDTTCSMEAQLCDENGNCLHFAPGKHTLTVNFTSTGATPTPVASTQIQVTAQ